MKRLLDLAERGVLPDAAVRLGIRRLLAQRLRSADRGDCELNRGALDEFVEQLRQSPIALEQPKANQQHYEVPAAFFARMLGPRLKYSSCLWPAGATTLAQAEEAMLELTCRRAELADGQRILELGCGWGSLALWMAEHYPKSPITALSNSHSQREFIEAQAAARGLTNLQVVTCDIATFQTTDRFDRVVSVEMFEHVRNYQELLRRIAGWLQPDGRLFVHIFCHRQFAYPFEDTGDDEWMARNFFSGGIMPADDLLLYFQRDLAIRKHWRVSGTHYARTLEAWLVRLDADRSAIQEIFATGYPPGEAPRVVQRWRMFLMACAELFNYRGGQEWWVAHYLFERRAA